jgi:hypothetical protein
LAETLASRPIEPPVLRRVLATSTARGPSSPIREGCVSFVDGISATTSPLGLPKRWSFETYGVGGAGHRYARAIAKGVACPPPLTLTQTTSVAPICAALFNASFMADSVSHAERPTTVAMNEHCAVPSGGASRTLVPADVSSTPPHARKVTANTAGKKGQRRVREVKNRLRHSSKHRTCQSARSICRVG